MTQATPAAGASARHWRARAVAALAGVAALLLTSLALHAAAQEMPPRVTVEVELDGARRPVDIFRPAGIPVGLAVIAHGFTRSRVRHGNLGSALAQAGVITVIPDLPNVVDLWGNGQAVVQLVEKLERGDVPTVAAPRERIVLVGTSAGGLATVLAAARLPGIAGWIGLDPVDRTGTGRDAAAGLRAPAVVMLADASLCNLVTSGEAIAAALPRRMRTLAVDGASHCDFEDPTNTLCEAACGRSSQPLRETIRAEIVATVREMLALAASRDAAAEAAPAARSPPVDAPPTFSETSP